MLFPNSFCVFFFFTSFPSLESITFFPPLARLSRQWHFHCATVPLDMMMIKLAYKGLARRGLPMPGNPHTNVREHQPTENIVDLVLL